MTALSEDPEAGEAAAHGVPPDEVPPDVAARLVRALDRSPSMVVGLIDPDLTTRWMSRSATWVVGADPGDRVGHGTLEEVHPDDVERIIHGMMQLRTSTRRGLGGKLTIEPLRYRYRKRDGSWIALEALVQNFLDDPEVNGLIVISRPVGGEMDGVAHVVDLLVADAPLPDVLTACARLVPDFLGHAAVVGIVDGEPVVGVAPESPAARLVADDRWWRDCVADGRARLLSDYAEFPDDLAAAARAAGYGCAWAIPVVDRPSREVMGCVVVWVWVPAEHNLGTEHGLGHTTRLANLVLGERRRQGSLRREAATDPLTRLGNRSALRQRLDAAAGPVTLALLDLDAFKPVNDTYGHDIGDAVLRVVADRLQATVRGDDLVTRFGGDEFAIVFSDGTPPEGVASSTERIRAAIARPVAVEGGPVVSVGISIGVATGPVTEVVARADAELYEVKRSKHLVPPRERPAAS
jgi:diguanylate cyclase (GGDEF)-like protein